MLFLLLLTQELITIFLVSVDLIFVLVLFEQLMSIEPKCYLP